MNFRYIIFIASIILFCNNEYYIVAKNVKSIEDNVRMLQTDTNQTSLSNTISNAIQSQTTPSSSNTTSATTAPPSTVNTVTTTAPPTTTAPATSAPSNPVTSPPAVTTAAPSTSNTKVSTTTAPTTAPTTKAPSSTQQQLSNSDSSITNSSASTDGSSDTATSSAPSWLIPLIIGGTVVMLFIFIAIVVGKSKHSKNPSLAASNYNYGNSVTESLPQTSPNGVYRVARLERSSVKTNDEMNNFNNDINPIDNKTLASRIEYLKQKNEMNDNNTHNNRSAADNVEFNL